MSWNSVMGKRVQKKIKHKQCFQNVYPSEHQQTPRASLTNVSNFALRSEFERKTVYAEAERFLGNFTIR